MLDLNQKIQLGQAINLSVNEALTKLSELDMVKDRKEFEDAVVSLAVNVYYPLISRVQEEFEGKNEPSMEELTK